jgi:hypothetical protein
LRATFPRYVLERTHNVFERSGNGSREENALKMSWRRGSDSIRTKKALSRRLQGFCRDGHWQRCAGSVTLPAPKGIEECPVSKHVICLGGYYGYYATILAGGS